MHPAGPPRTVERALYGSLIVCLGAYGIGLPLVAVYYQPDNHIRYTTWLSASFPTDKRQHRVPYFRFSSVYRDSSIIRSRSWSGEWPGKFRMTSSLANRRLM